MKSVTEEVKPGNATTGTAAAAAFGPGAAVAPPVAAARAGVGFLGDVFNPDIQSSREAQQDGEAVDPKATKPQRTVEHVEKLNEAQGDAGSSIDPGAHGQ